MGNGVPNQENHVIFEPLSGDLGIRLVFAQHMDLTRAQSNTVRAAVLAAGGMSNVTLAYTALRGALDGIEPGRDVWLDAMTTGADGTETALLRRGRVWLATLAEIPSPPVP
jgi:hypothetical protein